MTTTPGSHPIRRLLSGLVAVAALTMLFGATAMAQGGQGIAVLVNDEPITEYDVQQRLRLMAVSGGPRGGERVRKQVIDQLIEEKLMMQEAKRLNVDIPEDRVQQELRNIARRAKMTPDQFAQALRQSGINMNSFAKRLEVQFVWPTVVQRRFARSIKVHPDDIDSAVQRLGGAKNKVTHYEFTLQGILFIVPPGASDATRNARRNMAERLRHNYRSCAETKGLVAGLPDVVITDLGKRTSDTMPSSERELFAKLKVNETTPPRLSPNGVELIAVCAKSAIADEQVARREAEVKLLNQEFEVLARRHLHDLKQDAVIEWR